MQTMVRIKIRTAFISLLAATQLSQGEAAVTTYKFPETKYPVAKNHNGGMVHGICVLGAKDVTTTISPNDSGFKYTNIPDFRDGVQAFGDFDVFKMSGIDGNGDPVCEGGTYLQPSAVYGPPPGVNVTLEATAMDTTTGITLCVFVERELTEFNVNRQGNWKDPLIADGFVAGPHLTYAPLNMDPDRYTSFCKQFPPPPPPPPTTYHFPRTKYPEVKNSNGGMVHGICVLGAKDVTTTISPNNSGFKYTNIPGFKDGVQAFGVGPWKMSGVTGNGDQVCEGGTYLQPSAVYGPPSGVDITLEATALDTMTGITLCVFVEKLFGQYNRQGNWKDPLIADGFVAGLPLSYAPNGADPDRYTSYCKVLEPDLKYMPGSNANSCPDDVKVKRTYGTTEFPESSITPAVSIISQETSTVTIALNQAWGATVDKYFYEYSETLFTSKCYEVEGVAPGETIDTITLQCLVTSPHASLRICLQDTSNSLLSAEDDAVVSKCCQSDAPKDTPTVCYNLDILCETSCGSDESVARYIRGRF